MKPVGYYMRTDWLPDDECNRRKVKRGRGRKVFKLLDNIKIEGIRYDLTKDGPKTGKDNQKAEQLMMKQTESKSKLWRSNQWKSSDVQTNDRKTR